MEDSNEANSTAADSRAACLYQETRLSIGPPSSKAIVDVPVVTSSSSVFASRVSPKRRRVDQVRHTQDEAAFARSTLASESSIHFRQVEVNAAVPLPRSVLWRVLDGNRTLELQPIDLYQDPPHEDEPFLTLRFELHGPVSPCAIAFSEQSEDDGPSTLLVFAVVQDGSLVTLSLRQEAFVKRGCLEIPTASSPWSNIRNIPAFAARKVYRIHATGKNVLWASLIDGSLVRLDRYKAGTEYEWRQTHFSTGDWKTSFRGLVAWSGQSMVRYGDQDLDPKAATTIAASPNGRHMWTVCLDHSIRAWDVTSGRVIAILDLAGDPDRDFDRPAQQLLDPNQPQLLSFRAPRAGHDDDDDLYTMVTYSPVTQDFKFWAVDASIVSSIDVKELYPDFRFRPPIDALTGSHGWRLEQYYAVPLGDGLRSHEWRLWLSVRAGPRYHVLTIDLDANLPSKRLQRTWEAAWSSVDRGRCTADDFRNHPANPLNQTIGSTATALPPLTERWVNFLLSPGRFSTKVLETALVVYQRGPQKARQDKSAIRLSQASLKDRLCAAVGQAATTAQSTQVHAAFDAQEQELAARWSIYYGLVNDLQKQRERPVALAFDEHKQVPWLVMADHVSSIRDCSQLEKLWHNRSAYAAAHKFQPQDPLLKTLHNADDSQVGQLFQALSIFRKGFSDDFLLSFERALEADALRQDYSATVEDRLQSLYDQSGFAGKVSDDDYNRVTDALACLGGFEELGKSVFDKTIEFLNAHQHGRPQQKEINPYGCQTMLNGARDALALGHDMLVDAALLVVFTAVELVADDYSEDLQPFDIFENISSKYREYELLSWLSRTTMHGAGIPDAQGQDSGSPVLFESLFGGDWRDIKTPNAPEQSLLMYWIRVWTFGSRLTANYDDLVPYIMAVLLTNGDLDHASQLIRFLPDSAWALYVKARYYLMAGEHEDAAECFERAEPELSNEKLVGEYDSHSLLLQVDDRNSFNDGSARFYHHVLGLFEKAEAMSYAAHYSRLALKGLENNVEKDIKFKSDLLSRLFVASIHTSRFEEAFEALMQYSDAALRRPALQTLIKSLITTNQTQLLISLPFTADLAHEADIYLNFLCTSISVSTRPPSSSSSRHNSNNTTITSQIAPYKILYAFRTHRSDHRGAALALYTRVQQLLALRHAPYHHYSTHETNTNNDNSDLHECYLACINSLLLVSPDLRWLLVRPLPTNATLPPPKKARFGDSVQQQQNGDVADGSSSNASKGPKQVRRVVTIDDVRREWQDELDRRADVEAGRVPLDVEGFEMDLGADGGIFDVEEAGQDVSDAFGGVVSGRGAGVGDGPMDLDVFAA